MTTAAQRFLDAVSVSWDTQAPWEATAAHGLAEVDEDCLRQFCEQSGEEYAAVEAEVLASIRAKVAEA